MTTHKADYQCPICNEWIAILPTTPPAFPCPWCHEPLVFDPEKQTLVNAEVAHIRRMIEFAKSKETLSAVPALAEPPTRNYGNANSDVAEARESDTEQGPAGSKPLDFRGRQTPLSGGSNAGKDSNIKCDVKKSGMGTDQRTNPSPAQRPSPDVSKMHWEEQEVEYEHEREDDETK